MPILLPRLHNAQLVQYWPYLVTQCLCSAGPVPAIPGYTMPLSSWFSTGHTWLHHASVQLVSTGHTWLHHASVQLVSTVHTWLHHASVQLVSTVHTWLHHASVQLVQNSVGGSSRE